SIDLTHFFRALPRVAAELCAAALELDADAAFARKAIASRPLVCPDIGCLHWPWPLRVRTLGGFAVERDGVPVRFSRKAPKRLLDMLRLITALGSATSMRREWLRPCGPTPKATKHTMR
ncbi:MAG TPA: hypothetical protein VF319_17450, partial [Caldimonas sp.]